MIYELSEKNVLAHTEIEQIVTDTKYGSIPLTLDISEGKIVGIQGASFKSVKYKDDRNTEAISEFVELLRDAIDDKQHGTVSGTFILKEGRIAEVVTQTGIKVVFKR